MKTALSTINLVVGGLVLITLGMLALVGIIAIDDTPASVPEGLWTLLGGAVGALAAMLSRTSTTPDAPPPASATFMSATSTPVTYTTPTTSNSGTFPGKTP